MTQQFGCSGTVNQDGEDDQTQVTRLLQGLDECLEESQENLEDVNEKADRLHRRASDVPERVREALTPLPAEPED